MIRFITYLITLLLLFFMSLLDAQNTSKLTCSANEYNQFNFWIGEWNVYDNNDKLIGENIIKSMPNACAIQENWTSAKGNSLGTSYSYYDASDKKWHQLWIDNKGYVLATEGNFANNTMVLTSKLVQSKKGDFYNRITWTQNEDGSVTQIWDYLDTNNKIIQQAFKGIYKKKKS